MTLVETRSSYIVIILILTVGWAAVISSPVKSSPDMQGQIRSLLTECRDLEISGDYERWLEAAKEAAMLADSALPDQDLLRLASHRWLGRCYLSTALFKDAAMEFEAAAMVPNRPDSTTYWSTVADLAFAKIHLGEYRLARDLLDSALNHLSVFDDRGPLAYERARALRYLGTWYNHVDLFDSSLVSTREALRLIVNRQTPDTLELAALYEQLANISHQKAQPAAAKERLAEVRLLLSRKLPLSHCRLAIYYEMMGLIHEQQAHFDSAQGCFDTALACARHCPGNSELRIAAIKKSLCKLYWTTGRYSENEGEAAGALRTFTEYYGELNPQVASLESNLGTVDWVVGSLERAEMHFKRSISIQEKLFDGDRLELGIVLNNLALVYRRLGRLDEAEPLLVRSLGIRERLLGKEHPDVARALNNMANLYMRRGQPNLAQPLLERALHVWETKLDPNHPEVGVATYNLANNNYFQCRYRDALGLFRRTHAIWSRAFGPKHPFPAKSLSGLAYTFAAIGWLDSSLVYYRRLLELRQDFVKYAFSFTSDRDKLKVLTEHPVIDNSLLTLAAASQEQSLIRLAFESVLRGKMIALDASKANRSSLFCSTDSSVTRDFRQYRAVCDSLSAFTLAPVTGRADADLLNRLIEAHDSLESKMTFQCAQFRQDVAWRSVTIEAVTAALPESTALWEFVCFNQYDIRGQGSERERKGAPHYAAFVLAHHRTPRLVDLGPTAAIDSLVRRAHGHLSGSLGPTSSALAAELEGQWIEISSALKARVYSPLDAVTPPGSSLIIAPDGLLSRLPFEALPDSSDSYLVETRTISYALSGRDLLSYRADRPLQGDALILADPAFDSPGHPERSESVSDHGDTESNDKGSPWRPFGSWLPLSQTRKESFSISASFAGERMIRPIVRTGSEASEAALKQLAGSPTVLHIATHGFVLARDSQANANDPVNPLLRCGLVLAGANHSMSDPAGTLEQQDDGILTALEISAIDLTGTQLVCLSACESGSGDIIDGEGVIGLRRAFRIAGAQSLVTTLCDVSDDLARSIVVAFYRTWLGGSSRRQALREAELEALAEARRLYHSGHPRLWAGFILEGSPW